MRNFVFGIFFMGRLTGSRGRFCCNYPITALCFAARVVVIIAFLGLAVTAKAGDHAYVVTSTAQFGTIDLNTGAFTQIGSMSQTLCNLGTYAGNLYGYACGTSTLYQINPANGSLTLIGSAEQVTSYRGMGSTTTGLYGFDQSMNLYSINASTGAATLIGPTGFPCNPGGFTGSTGSTTLYFLASNDFSCTGTPQRCIP